MGIATQILGLIACISFLVITHELGHYTFARIFHTRVDKFYMFFNPYFSIFKCKKFNGKWHFKFFARNLDDMEEELDAEGKPVLDEKGKKKMVRIDTDKLADDDWRKYPENTEWGIGWLPLGGYCSINGMVDENTKASELSSEPQPWEFRSKPAWQRFFIILGGVLVNFITALILYVVILFTWGEDYIPVENARYGMHFSEVAQQAGFQNGDKIITVDGVKPERQGDLVGAVLINGAQRVVVERPVDSIAINEDSTYSVVKTIYEKTTVYLNQDFAKTLLGADKSEQYFCQFEMPFILDSVPSDSPAASAGLQKGDSLVAVDGKRMFSFYSYQKYFNNHPSSLVSIVYSRNGEKDTTVVKLNEDGKMMVFPKAPAELLGHKHVDYGFWKSIPAGISKGFSTLGDYVKQFKLIFTKEGATQIGGFGTIGSIFPKAWNWQAFWSVTAFIAVILAFMNFLPIPMLDGGYILFILVEMITRRKPSDKFIGYANTVGFILLIALLIYANGLDILRFFK